MVAVAVRHVAADRQPVRVHDREADGVADRDVVRDLAVVGVHVVDGEAQVAEAVAGEHVLAAGDGEDAVAAVADVVVEDLGARRVPDRDAVAGLVQAARPDPDDLVAAHDRILRRRGGRRRRDCPRSGCPRRRRRSRVFSTKTPASIFSRSLPEPRIVSPRTTASGAETVTTLPLPGPIRTAPGSPSTVSLRVDPDRPAVLAGLEARRCRRRPPRSTMA